MGPYLAVPKKEKDSIDGENAKVPLPHFMLTACRWDMAPPECKAGETPWRIRTSLNSISVMELHFSAFMTDMEVSAEDNQYT